MTDPKPPGTALRRRPWPGHLRPPACRAKSPLISPARSAPQTLRLLQLPSRGPRDRLDLGRRPRCKEACRKTRPWHERCKSPWHRAVRRPSKNRRRRKSKTGCWLWRWSRANVMPGHSSKGRTPLVVETNRVLFRKERGLPSLKQFARSFFCKARSI